MVNPAGPEARVEQLVTPDNPILLRGTPGNPLLDGTFGDLTSHMEVKSPRLRIRPSAGQDYTF